MIHDFGLVGKVDQETARRYYSSSAKARCPMAARLLARLWFEGLGGPRDPQKAFELVRGAALLGDGKAQYLLAGMYAEARGVAADPKLALAWCRIAHDNGIAAAAEQIASLERALGAAEIAAAARTITDLRARIDKEQENGVVAIELPLPQAAGAAAAADHDAAMGRAMTAWEQQDWAMARELLTPLAEAGDAAAQFYVARMLQMGYGAPEDPARAAAWYVRSAQGGIASAMLNLGCMFRDGHGLPKDQRAATDLFQLAAGHGNATGALNTGFAYGTGTGRTRDLVEAHAWYAIAAAGGEDDAARNLEIVERQMDERQLGAARQRAQELRRKIDQKAFEPGELPPLPTVPGTPRRIDTGGQGRGDAASPPAAAPAAALRFRMLRVEDPQVGGDEAFTMLIPSGWIAEGGIVWQHDYSNLATVSLRVSDPQGSAALEFLPITPFVWRDGGVDFIPIGGNWLGSEVCPLITDPAQFVRDIVVPRHRPYLQNARLIERVDMPDVAQHVAHANTGSGVQASAQAARLRFEFDAGGRAMQEDVYVALIASRSPINPGTAMFRADRLFTFRAERGRLDAHKDLVTAVVASFRLNPVWYGKYQEVFALMLQRQRAGIAAAGELSRLITKTNEEIANLYRESYETYQRSQDSLADSYSRYLRGVERYDDPYSGHSVSLPSGYQDAWVSRGGEYILSNQAGFDPNQGGAVEWSKMGTTRLGR